MKAVLPWAIVILSSLLTAIVPFVYMKWTLGAWLPNILPQLGPDVLYYLKQIRDVVDGHWSLGNPYFVEWADARFPGLVLPIWIGAFPAIFGLQIGGIFAFNAIVYPILMGVLSYILFRKLVGNEWFAVVCTVLTVCTLHSFLMRPILQVVYPVLVLFLLALLEVARRRDVKMKYVWLGASMSAAFYLYPHLWMPEFAAVGLFLLLCAAKREWETVKNLMVMLLCVGIVCIPQISTILSLFSNEMARLINERSGLVESHRVLPLTIFNIKYMILLVIGFGAISYKRRLHSGELLVLLCSFGIIAAALSNVITGQVMDLDTHPLWISYPLNIIAIGVLVAALWERKTRAETLVLGILLAAMVFTSGARLVRNSFSYVFNSVGGC